MCNKGLIITNAFSYRESVKYQVERLKSEFLKLNIQIDHITNSKLLVYINQDYLVCNLKEFSYDFIIYLDKDKYIANMLERAGFKLFNPPSSIENCDDKMLTHILLSNHNIKMPKTMSYPLCYDYNNNFSEFLPNIIFNFSFPFIIKENYGSLGKQVYLIANKAELIVKEKELRYKPHIYQEYIKESSGVDYRLFVIGNKVVASMKRVNESNFKANIALGGKGYNYQPDDKMVIIAEKASKILCLDYCAIDFVKNRNNEPILIEVNSNAYFTEIEKVTNKNIAQIYAKYIFSKIYKS